MSHSIIDFLDSVQVDFDGRKDPDFYLVHRQDGPRDLNVGSTVGLTHQLSRQKQL